MMYSRSLPPDPIPIVGYTTRRHLILDLDSVTLYKARSIARKIMWEWPKVGDCLLILSSEGTHRLGVRYTRMGRPLVIYARDNYHLVFDNGIGYNLSCRICETLAHLGILNRDYVKIREFRGDMTLRVGPAVLLERYKPVPRVIERVFNNFTRRRDGYIPHYLRFKKKVERVFCEVATPSLVPCRPASRKP